MFQNKPRPLLLNSLFECAFIDALGVGIEQIPSMIYGWKESICNDWTCATTHEKQPIVRENHSNWILPSVQMHNVDCTMHKSILYCTLCTLFQTKQQQRKKIDSDVLFRMHLISLLLCHCNYESNQMTKQKREKKQHWNKHENCNMKAKLLFFSFVGIRCAIVDNTVCRMRIWSEWIDCEWEGRENKKEERKASKNNTNTDKSFKHI